MFFGCNCKQQTKAPITHKVIQVNGETEIVNEPKYSQDEVQRIENWLNSLEKSTEETNFVFEFNKNHFGEIMQGYCDIPCQHRIRRRVEHMKEKLNKWKKEK